MKDAIWEWVRSSCQGGSILPWWALTIRMVLYPLDFFYWSMNKKQGYQVTSDTWLIGGVCYSGNVLRLLSNARGQIYRVNRIGKTVVFERVHDDEFKEGKRELERTTK